MVIKTTKTRSSRKFPDIALSSAAEQELKVYIL
jgi:hypothetical protein